MAYALATAGVATAAYSRHHLPCSRLTRRPQTRAARGALHVVGRAARRPFGVEVDTWEELDCGSFIITPRGRPKALVHFLGDDVVSDHTVPLVCCIPTLHSYKLKIVFCPSIISHCHLAPAPTGGAFVGRAPHIAYQVFCRELCDAGFAVATTPYGLTFEHVQCALRVAEARAAIVAEFFDEPPLVFGVGHSNGALLHALIASLPEVPTIHSRRGGCPPATRNPAAHVRFSAFSASLWCAEPAGFPS